MTRRAQALHGMALLLAACLAQAEPIGYVVNSDSREDDAFSLVRVDLATGAHTVLGDSGYIDVEGLAFSPDGTLYGVDDATKTLLTFNLDTGEATPVGSGNGNLGVPTGQNQARDFGLAFDTEGNLWLSSDITGQIWRVDPETGTLLEEVVPASATATLGDADGTKSTANPGALTGLAACGSSLFGIGSHGDERLYSNVQSGSPRLVGSLGAALIYDDAGLDFDAEGKLWGIADRSAIDPDRDPSTNNDPQELNEPSIIFTVDLATGAAVRVAETIVGVESLAIGPPSACEEAQTSSLPIPTLSLGPLLALLLGVAALARRALPV